MAALPLLVFDTNILMDVLLGRDGNEAVLLVELAEATRVELVVPEYVLMEFRGTALRWVRDELERVRSIRRFVNEWARSRDLAPSAGEAKAAAVDVETKLKALQGQVYIVNDRIRSAARVVPHTVDVHMRGDLRYLAGHPPDRPADGLKDCRIYEAVLEVAQAERATSRPKFLVTRDSDFDVQELETELAGVGFTIRKDPGRLYRELK
jgi:predicted nucleic acid-binding protein